MCKTALPIFYHLFLFLFLIQYDPTHFQTTPSRVVLSDVGSHWTLFVLLYATYASSTAIFFFFLNLKAHSFSPVLLELFHLLTYFCFHLVGSYSSSKFSSSFPDSLFLESSLIFPRKILILFHSEDLHT